LAPPSSLPDSISLLLVQPCQSTLAAGTARQSAADAGITVNVASPDRTAAATVATPWSELTVRFDILADFIVRAFPHPLRGSLRF
jgi:hypothetical protein